MSCYVVEGGRPLSGEVSVQGAKNSVLPILAATLLSGGVCLLENCPWLRDVDASCRILEELGCHVRRQGDSLEVDASVVEADSVPDALMREMRSSAIFLGALLTRCGRAELSYPGGCELGPRPIDLHLSGLRRMGAEIREEGGRLVCEAPRLRGSDIVLSLPSVGATENLMLAACGAEGVTRIFNAAREPEIAELQDFLKACGAEITGAGTDRITVCGGRALHGCRHTVRADRIVAATYLCAVASAGGEAYLRGADASSLAAVLTALREAGCELRGEVSGIYCRRTERLRPVSAVRTAPYPGFPTDAQAVLMASLLKADGVSMFEENIFENRYRHVDELVRMGAGIRVSGRVAVVTGTERLYGASVRATDLRGGAALCVAALAAEGSTAVRDVAHILRGYADLPGDLRRLGAQIVCAEE